MNYATVIKPLARSLQGIPGVLVRQLLAMAEWRLIWMSRRCSAISERKKTVGLRQSTNFVL